MLRMLAGFLLFVSMCAAQVSAPAIRPEPVETPMSITCERGVVHYHDGRLGAD